MTESSAELNRLYLIRILSTVSLDFIIAKHPHKFSYRKVLMLSSKIVRYDTMIMKSCEQTVQSTCDKERFAKWLPGP